MSGGAKGRGLGWPAGIGIILVSTMAMNVWMMRVAGSDPSFAVEADYYQKAVHYDDVVAQRARNAELAWRMEPAIVADGDGGDALLRVRLADSSGRAIVGATVTVEAFPVARSSEVLHATLVPEAMGEGYEARIPAPRSGRWEIRLAAVRGGDHFTAIERLEVAAGVARGNAGGDGVGGGVGGDVNDVTGTVVP